MRTKICGGRPGDGVKLGHFVQAPASRQVRSTSVNRPPRDMRKFLHLAEGSRTFSGDIGVGTVETWSSLLSGRHAKWFWRCADTWMGWRRAGHVEHFCCAAEEIMKSHRRDIATQPLPCTVAMRRMRVAQRRSKSRNGRLPESRRITRVEPWLGKAQEGSIATAWEDGGDCKLEVFGSLPLVEPSRSAVSCATKSVRNTSVKRFSSHEPGFQAVNPFYRTRQQSPGNSLSKVAETACRHDQRAKRLVQALDASGRVAVPDHDQRDKSRSRRHEQAQMTQKRACKRTGGKRFG